MSMIFKCKMCGGDLEIKENSTVCECEYCGTTQTLPKIDNDRRANLYDRANHFRRNNEFDKAMGIYEQILNDDGSDAEAYWSIVLCRYGIEYVEDPTTHKRVPTVNRAQFTSIFDDANYQSALEHADSAQREVYKAEAEAINEIQKGILEISSKEEPFDVFICYKETDNNGRRTPDSVLANDLYHQLTQEGFKVFFARITLEDKIGSAYEPYIFAALNSAKVMVVLGTKPEYFNAVWVKNEWSRYLSLIKSGAKKMLIPAYKDMDPYDLPEEFSHLQAQDMSKLGFMQDLIRGIKKITAVDEPKIVKQETVVVQNESNGNITALLKRAKMALEDGEFGKADDFCEQVLNQDAENADAYLYKLYAEFEVCNRAQFRTTAKNADNINNSKNFAKACKFGKQAELDEDINEILYNQAARAFENAYYEDAYDKVARLYGRISGYKDADEKVNEAIAAGKECTYKIAEKAFNEEAYNKAAELYHHVSGYKDSDEKIKICEEKTEIAEQERIVAEKKAQRKKKNTIIASCAAVLVIIGAIVTNNVIIPSFKYNKAVSLMENGSYDEASESFIALGEYKDSLIQLQESQYLKAVILADNGEYDKAISTFIELGDYKDSVQKISDVDKERNYKNALSLLKSGSYDDALSIFTELNGYKDSNEKVDICLLNMYNAAVDLMNDGDYKNAISTFRKLNAYKDSTAKLTKCIENIQLQLPFYTISAGVFHTVGLKSDSTAVAVGNNDEGQCNISDWVNIVAISAGYDHTVGLKSDGTVVATGGNDDGQCNVSGWRNIVAISAGYDHTVGLKSDGTVVATGSNYNGECDVSDWKDIIAISAKYFHTVGLKSDGTVVAVGNNDEGQCNVSSWKDIVAISTGYEHTAGLKLDGTVVATGSNGWGECNVSDWTDIVAVDAGGGHTVGLKADGTVVAVGNNDYGQCNVSDWTDIVAVAAGNYHTVGLRADGTVTAVGNNNSGQCDVSDWTDIAVHN